VGTGGEGVGGGAGVGGGPGRVFFFFFFLSFSFLFFSFRNFRIWFQDMVLGTWDLNFGAWIFTPGLQSGHRPRAPTSKKRNKIVDHHY
jgi:hypothetical protein